MDLYILRHAIAVERGSPGIRRDFDRPLTPEGRQKLRRVVKGMQNLKLSFGLILASPYVRARETAEEVANAFALKKKLELTAALGADSLPADVIPVLRQRRPALGSVLLVGHEPYLSGLISLLITGTPQAAITMKKAGLCRLSVATLRAGRCATLEWLLTPSQLVLLA